MLEYNLIKQHYEARRAKRSGVPLINHINEGLIILDKLGATQHSKAAFCLHPLVQADNDLICFKDYHLVDPYALLLAMEYRNVANAYLSYHTTAPRLSPLKEVNDMLIADKVQNKKDFMLYHYGTHPRSERLLEYFDEWLYTLNVSDDMYKEFLSCLGQSKAV